MKGQRWKEDLEAGWGEISRIFFFFFFRNCTLWSVLSPCVVWESWWSVTWLVEEEPSHHEQTVAYELPPRTLWDLKAGAVCLFNGRDFHSPALQVGRMMDSSQTLAHFLQTVQHLCESRLLPTRPHGAEPVNIWCLLWMAWSEVFVVIKSQTNRTQQKKS